MNPTLDFYWVFLFVPLKIAKQFRSFRRNFFYCERSTKRSRIEESVSKSPPREVALINWNLPFCWFFLVGDGFPVPREAKRLPYMA